ncbi:MAG TPA: DUF2617 family protein, partial [Urbifossiella sp.]|nr:DUF2617 family protein [Urbifossiella sp.]
LHPELFDTAAVRRVDRNGVRVTVRITPTGHVLEWTDGATTLTELIATTDPDLPARGRRLGHRLGGGRGGRCEVGRGVRYQVSSQVEVLPPEQFVRAHEELRSDGARKGLVSHGRGGDRLGLSPLGVVVAEALAGGLAVSAFHTFPYEFAVVKTQSLIERG